MRQQLYPTLTLTAAAFPVPNIVLVPRLVLDVTLDAAVLGIMAEESAAPAAVTGDELARAVNAAAAAVASTGFTTLDSKVISDSSSLESLPRELFATSDELKDAATAS